MSVNSELKKAGIEVIEELDTMKINSIARYISSSICENFPNYGFNQNELFIRLCRVNMYRAKMAEGMAEANYFYKNNSIYFNEHIEPDDIEEFAIHECIHFIQEVKDRKNDLIKMGLCDYTEFKVYGLGLNEAAVQLISSKIVGIPKEYVKYFNISFETTSPSYYPLECCLVSQLGYLVGEDILFESTLKSNNNFKNKLIEAISYKAFMTVQNSIDDILYTEEKIIKLNNKIIQIDDRNKKVDNMLNKINELKSNITSTFISTQNLIISSYFDNLFDKITNMENVEKFRKKLYEFKSYLGFTEGYTFFNNYYIEMMSKLEHKSNIIENGGIETAMNINSKKQNKFITLLKAIKRLILGEKYKEKNYE